MFLSKFGGRHGRDRMVVGFTTTYAMHRLTIACLNLLDIEPRYEPGEITRQSMQCMPITTDVVISHPASGELHNIM